MGIWGSLASGLRTGLREKRDRELEDAEIARREAERLAEADYRRQQLELARSRDARADAQTVLENYGKGFKPAEEGPSLQGMQTHDLGRLGGLFDRVIAQSADTLKAGQATPGQVPDLGPKLSRIAGSTMRPKTERVAGTNYVFDRDDNPDVREANRRAIEQAEGDRRWQRQRQVMQDDALERDAFQESLIRGRPPRGGAGGGGGKLLPASAVKDVNEWQALYDSAKDAAATFNAIPEGQNTTGWAVGRAAAVLGQLGVGTGKSGINSPTAIAARSKLANISTALGKLRSGGVITPQEYERLEGLIPNKNDDEAVVREKLTELTSYLERTLNRNLDTFEGSGYDVTKVRPAASAAAASSGDPMEEARQEALDAIRQGAPAAEVRRRFRAEFEQDLRP